jgi:hypothetical protein
MTLLTNLSLVNVQDLGVTWYNTKYTKHSHTQEEKEQQEEVLADLDIPNHQCLLHTSLLLSEKIWYNFEESNKGLRDSQVKFELMWAGTLLKTFRLTISKSLKWLRLNMNITRNHRQKKCSTLKRSNQCNLINPYNKKILKTWRANMIFSSDQFACAQYVVILHWQK